MRVTINSEDAKATWGIVFDSSSISALMTPAGMKDNIESQSRLEDGKRVVTSPELAKLNSRTLTLTFALCAKSEDDFFTKYDSFCAEIQKTGRIYITLSVRPEIVYKLIYKSCNQFTQFNNKLAKFSLRCEEPNPRDRTL